LPVIRLLLVLLAMASQAYPTEPDVPADLVECNSCTARHAALKRLRDAEFAAPPTDENETTIAVAVPLDRGPR
jgi:hypothetical protein